ncbi:MAG TPA: WXG100 family type VII secretion target [Mycobacterium sp.]|jgi:WXG100 family type VII secretion target
MTSTGSGSLTTDFDLMRDVAAKIDGRNDEIRTMLQGFIGRMTSVPPSVWGGNAATAFKSVVDRWNSESVRLQQALGGIAETIRANERVLRAAGDTHSQHIGAIAENL